MTPLKSTTAGPMRASDLTRRRRQRTQTPQFFEAGTILTVNLFLTIVAATSLSQLISHQLAQVQKLNEMRAEVNQVETRVNRLKTQLSQNLDPKQTSRIVEEQSNLIEAQQMRVVWVKPPATNPPAPSGN